MPATFTWTVQSLAVKPNEGNLVDVVVTARWQCDGNQNSYTASYYQSTSFAVPDESEFIQFKNLTQDDVLGWIWQYIDKAKIEGYVQSQINDQINPPIVYPALPWASEAQ